MRAATADAARDAARLTDAIAKPAAAVKSSPVPRRNFIDTIVFDRIKKDGIPHAGLSTDEEFVRRAYMDAIGLPPTADEVRGFVADRSKDKRDRLIDTLSRTTASPSSGRGTGATCCACRTRPARAPRRSTTG